ncbi:Thioredoxin reductase [subsurface metagenome]
MGNTYEVIIVGGGPAGLTAGLYASRARLRTLLIEKGIFGGQIANAAHVENYPGFPDGISGLELGELMHRQATEYGLETVAAEVYGIALAMGGTVIETTEGDYLANAVIIATGAEFNRLGVPGEERLTGKGVSYCATCDGPFFKDRVVAVVGGGDSAVEEGILLTRFASEVILIHRRDQLRASRLLQERAFANKKMAFLWDTVVEEILGDERVTGLRVRHVKIGESSTLDASAAFIYVGQRPNTDYLRGLIPLDEAGCIPTNERMETEIKGIFAAGDIRKNSSRQAITAAGDGATAAISAEKFLIQQ